MNFHLRVRGPMRHAFQIASFVVSSLCAVAAHAATVAVVVNDAVGQPLSRAMVSLEPLAGKLPIKPTPLAEVAHIKRQFNLQVNVLAIWIFEEAAGHWRTLHAGGLMITLSVNLSTRELLDQELLKKFDALLVKHQVPAKALCLEITESAIMDDPQRAQATLDRLSALGFKRSIDDFGTGYSSLAYLKRLPADELKIDQLFVGSMKTDPDDAKILRSTIDLAHNLSLTVVAEGVENAKV